MRQAGEVRGVTASTASFGRCEMARQQTTRASYHRREYLHARFDTALL